MSGLAIKINQLSRNFNGVTAVDSLSLEVPSGTIFGFLGPNGAGKTTTIRMLLGLLEPSSGSAEVLGYNTRTQGDLVRQHSGALLEHPGIYEHMTVEDNLEFFGRIWQIPDQERKTRIQDLLTRMDLWERRKDKAGDWSRGMRQKLALARVLLHRPKLVMLDEPTAGLDVMSATEVREGLASLAEREGVTVFLTTHNMAEAEKLCSQVAVIRKGKLVAVGRPDDLRSRSGGPRVQVVGRGFTPELVTQLRSSQEVAAVLVSNGHLEIDLRENIEVAPLVSLLVSGGAQVEEVRRGKASLEEVFVALMEEEK